MKIEAGAQVELAMRLFDESGEEHAVASREEPAHYIHAAGELLPALEAALEGALVGAELRVELEPQDAYGELDLEAIVAVPRSELPPDIELQTGDILPLHVEPEEGEEGEPEEIELVVREVRADAVFVDANHPLAGQRVVFEVEVLAVRPAPPA